MTSFRPYRIRKSHQSMWQKIQGYFRASWIYPHTPKARREAKQNWAATQPKEPPGWPLPLCAHRISLEEYNNDRTREPTRSALLRLPPELRLMIYEYVFGLDPIHVVTTYRKSQNDNVLESYACTDPDARTSGRECSCVPGRGIGILSLLLTCRMLYIDVIKFTFNNRTIEFNDANTVILFSTAIPRCHFDSITSLYFNAKNPAWRTHFCGTISHLPDPYTAMFKDLNPPNPQNPRDPAPGIWISTCHLISKMVGLKKLLIEISASAFGPILHSHWGEVWIWNEAFVLQPLMQIQQPSLQVFEVEIFWSAEEEPWDDSGKKFVLRRGEYVAPDNLSEFVLDYPEYGY